MTASAGRQVFGFPAVPAVGLWLGGARLVSTEVYWRGACVDGSRTAVTPFVVAHGRTAVTPESAHAVRTARLGSRLQECQRSAGTLFLSSATAQRSASTAAVFGPSAPKVPPLRPSPLRCMARRLCGDMAMGNARGPHSGRILVNKPLRASTTSAGREVHMVQAP